jgi:hypothetical protein
MKVTVNKIEDSKVKYPCLMVCKINKELITVFNNRKQGFVIVDGNAAGVRAGDIVTDINDYNIFTGSITLEND